MSLANNYNNQYYTKELITRKYSEIKRQLRTIGYNTCAAKITQSYIDTSIKQFDYGYVYRDTQNNNNIISFVLWDEPTLKNSIPTIYIRLMCGIGMGKLMFEDIENYARNKEIKQITLHPASKYLANHYKDTYGFKFKVYNKVKKSNLYYKNINTITNTYDKKLVKKYSLKHSKSKNITRKRNPTLKKLRNRTQNINDLNANSIRERIITLH
jgi:hypothetical protein